MSGNNREHWPFFDQVDAILDTRPSSAPVTLLQSESNVVLIDSESVDGKVPSVIFHSMIWYGIYT